MSILARLPAPDRLKTTIAFIRAFGLGFEQARVLSIYLGDNLFPELSDDEHLRAAMAWLAHAQDICGGQGVANLFYLRTGWGVAYPETSGYILATYLAYAEHGGEARYIDRAIQIGDWEITIQAPNGGVISDTEHPNIRVFNTGQVILGWCRLYEETGAEKYLQAAIRAGRYLVNEQEADGAWRRDTHCGARTYHARIDWALLRLAELTGEDQFATVARDNLQWVLDQQHDNGWFSQCGFDDSDPITHVIAYTLRGLLECYLMHSPAVKDLAILPAVIRCADALCGALADQRVRGIAGMVPTYFDQHWQSAGNDSCLTGNAQLSCFLYRLAQCTDNSSYRDTADTILSATKRTQLVDTSLLPIKGALAGTFPLSHGYVPNAYPNWAAKFFADALLMKMHFTHGLVIPA